MRAAPIRLVLAAIAVAAAGTAVAQEEPPAINPFGARSRSRQDAIAGYLELSNGRVYPGRLYLTRDARLRIFDQKLERHRDVPLRAIKQITCHVQKEWMEKEWRFRENASDVKVYTGRTYPARLYAHTITLKDGRKITGPLSGIVYVQPAEGGKAKRFLLHKRDKGPVGTTLKSLTYVRLIELGEQALQKAQKRAAKGQSQQAARGSSGRQQAQ